MARSLLFLRGMSELFSSVGALQRALDYHIERHNLLASNIANVDTPGFRPLELLRAEPLAPGVEALPLEPTRPGDLPLDATPGPALRGLELTTDPSAPVGADGNSVSLEREMSKLAANDLRYQSAARIVSRQLAMLRYAASDGTVG